MAQNKNQINIKVRKEIKEELDFLSEKTGQSKTKLLCEFINAVFAIGCTFQNLNLSYEFCISESKVTITCEGRNNLTVSEQKMPKAVLKEEAKAGILEVTVKPKVKGEK